MQKRSHKLLANALIESEDGFQTRRFELAFLFGSFQPDCNPLSYLKGSIRSYKFRGHNFTNSQRYIDRHILKLCDRTRWTSWQYYTLGKLTHYLADAFTYPHNENYGDTIIAHRQYEDNLRTYLADYLQTCCVLPEGRGIDVVAAIRELHQQYMEHAADMGRDVQYILKATALLMAGCLPTAAPAAA